MAFLRRRASLRRIVPTLICLAWSLLAAGLPAQQVRPGPPATSLPAANPSPTLPAATNASAPASPPAENAADEDGPAPAQALPSVDEIQKWLADLERLVPDEAQRSKVAENLQKALSASNALQQQQAEVQSYAAKIENYPNELQEYKDKLAGLPPKSPEINEDKSLAELEQELTNKEQELEQHRGKLSESNSQPKDRSDWLASVPKLTTDTQQEKERVQQQLDKLSPSDINDMLANSERVYLSYQKEALKKTLDALEKKREYYNKSSDLVQVRRDYRAKAVAQDEKFVAALRDVVNQQRRAEANQQASAAESAAAIQRPEAIAKLADNNAALAKAQAEIVEKIKEVTDQLSQTEHQLESIRAGLKTSRERVGAAGLTEASGQQLRNQQETLPDTQEIARDMAQQASEQADAMYLKYKLFDQRNEVIDTDLETRIDRVLEQLPPGKRESSKQEVRNLLESERKILESSITNYETYIANLQKLSSKEDELINTTEAYREFIAEHVLWIRSCSTPRPADVQPTLGALRWSLAPDHWWDALMALANRTRSAPLVAVLFAVVVCASLFFHHRLRVRLREIGEKSAKRTCTDFWSSCQALWITMVLALPWPLLMWFLGWWMDSPLNESEFVRALSVSLQVSAQCYLLFEVLRQLCRSQGLADAHFAWPQSCLVQVRRNVRWLIVACLPLVVWLTGLEVQNVEKLWSSTLGRICFVVVMALLGWACYRVLMVSSSPFRVHLLSKARREEFSFHALYPPLVTAVPILLVLLAVVGYYYTAQQLAVRLVQSAALVLALLIVGGLTKRWILLNRRRLAREQARQKRAAAAAAAAAAQTVDGETPVVQPAEFGEIVVEDTVDLVALGEQTSKLIVTILTLIGFFTAWFIWQDMLPALARVDQWPVVPGNDPAKTLNWGQLLQFCIVSVVAYIAVANVPALLEFAVLQHLPMDSGARYAVTSLCRYALAAVGIGMAYNSLDFDSTIIPWLVATMGVGLGFGLQEIFANFVSGVILLFERPIRVGDIVTIGDTTGQVNRIRMRATTVIDWDRKEYIVPNKDLITGQILNWTLTDQTSRVIINVGVAYGSDTERACELLREVAKENPIVLSEPEPLISFEGFGDSTLNLVMRAYLPNLENRLKTIHDLHTQINKRFNDAGIEIAFPQTDLHIRTVPPEWLKQPPTGNRTDGANGKSTKSDLSTTK